MLEYIERHPYIAGAFALGLVVLFIVLRRGGSGGDTVISQSGPSDAVVQTGAALQGAQLQSQTQIAGYNAALNYAELQTAADVEKTRLAAGVALENIFATRDLGFYTVDAQLRLGLAQVGQSSPLPASSPSGGSVPTYAPTHTVTSFGDGVSQQQQIAAGAQRQVDAAGNSILQHGISFVDCTQLPFGTQGSCATANTAALDASYRANPGSYLAPGVYAHTPEAWAMYGDPRVTYENMLKGDYSVN